MDSTILWISHHYVAFLAWHGLHWSTHSYNIDICMLTNGHLATISSFMTIASSIWSCHRRWSFKYTMWNLVLYHARADTHDMLDWHHEADNIATITQLHLYPTTHGLTCMNTSHLTENLFRLHKQKKSSVDGYRWHFEMASWQVVYRAGSTSSVIMKVSIREHVQGIPWRRASLPAHLGCIRENYAIYSKRWNVWQLDT